jgi:hypothetical protein
MEKEKVEFLPASRQKPISSNACFLEVFTKVGIGKFTYF